MPRHRFLQKLNSFVGGSALLEGWTQMGAEGGRATIFQLTVDNMQGKSMNRTERLFQIVEIIRSRQGT